MFLKEILRRLLFKQSCELCHKSVSPCLFFCEECQITFTQLISSPLLFQKKDTMIYLMLDKIPHIQVLKSKLQNPKNCFLIDALVGLVVLAFCELKLPWPKVIFETSWINNRKMNSAFFKKISQLTNCQLRSRDRGKIKSNFLLLE